MKVALSASVLFALLGPAHCWAPSWPVGWQWGDCISQSAAEALVAEYAAVIAQQDSALGSPIDTANAIAADSYYEQSDSANINIGIPLGALTAPSKAVFVSESQANPALVTETLGVYVACNSVTWQWVATQLGNGVYEIKGFHLFEVTPVGPQILNAHFEFNSIAGALDNNITDLLDLPNITVP